MSEWTKYFFTAAFIGLILAANAATNTASHLEKLERLAARGDSNAQFQLGAKYLASDQPVLVKRGELLLNQLALQSNTDAMVGLGAFYKSRYQYLEAWRFYRMAADRGVPAACVECGNLLQYNNSWDFREKKAVMHDVWSLYDRAARAGNADAKSQMARMLETGNGVPVDRKRALRLYEEVGQYAAAGYLLYTYDGDIIEAYKFLRLAELKRQSPIDLKLVTRKMSLQQVEEGERRFTAYATTHHITAK